MKYNYIKKLLLARSFTPIIKQPNAVTTHLYKASNMAKGTLINGGIINSTKMALSTSTIYTPSKFKCEDKNELQKIINEYDFSTVISHTKVNGIRVSHLPLMLVLDEGKYGTLVGHMSKGNSHWKDFSTQTELLCIFHGPHSYISPTWYVHKPEVPTWNYVVVHAYGFPYIVQEEEELYNLIRSMVKRYEPGLFDTTSEAYLSENFLKPQLKGIVGFKIPIHKLIGKFKLGQNRAKEDQIGLTEGLIQEENISSRQLGVFFKAYQARLKERAEKESKPLV